MSIPTAVDGVTLVDASLLNAYKAGIEACEPALGLPASSGYLLASDDEGGRSWVPVPAPSSSPTTAEGDLIVRGAAEDEALPVGDEGQVLAVTSGVPAWVTLPVLSSVCDARLTLTQGVPVTTSDVIGASTIYLTRYRGAHVALWDGSAWVLHEIPSADVSLALSGLTAGKVYDVFLHDNAGTLTLSLSAAWSDGTTRTNALAVQDGVRVLASDHTRRLVGTFVATGTDTTEDSGGTEDSSKQKRYLCNERHKVPRRAVVQAPWLAYTYSSDVWRVAGNTSSVYISALCGAGVPVGGCFGGTQETGSYWALALGLDGATTPDAAWGPVTCIGNRHGMLTAPLAYSVTEGLHEFRVLEKVAEKHAHIEALSFWLDLLFYV